MRILLVEDDPASVEILSRYLRDQHYAVDTASDGESGWRYATTYEYDLLVLDVILPHLDGISLCHRLRNDGFTTPIMLLTSQDSSTTKIMGLDAGADDYVVKPFDPAEWIARIRALLRRGCTNPLPILTWGNLWLNLSTCEVMYDSQPLTLSAKEYALLELLMRESQHVFSNEEILESLWSSEEFPVEATVRSHVRRLRHKLVAVGAPADLIATAHGRGYYLKPLASTQLPAMMPAMMPAIMPVEETLNRDPIREQAQYQEMLERVWQETLPRMHGHLQVLTHAIECLRQEQLTPTLQVQASHAAHALTGTLGTLGQRAAMNYAQELEQGFHQDLVLTLDDAIHLQDFVNKLTHAILTARLHPEEGQPLVPTPVASLPELLLVDADEQLCQELLSGAQHMGFEVTVMSGYEEALNWLTNDHFSDRNSLAGMIIGLPTPPPAVVKDGSANITTAAALRTALPLLEIFTQLHPQLPTIIIADHLNWTDRLEIVRRGAKSILPRSASLQALLEPLKRLHLAQQFQQGKRVMLVDDDLAVLRTLPSQLQSQGLEVSTLNDPQQFWTLLEVVKPDVLVLDIKMPLVNGLELCQVLRSDPQWQRMPILFLSVLSDGKTQSQAFAAGADDYLCKPVTGIDLANRIFHRLQRFQAWRSVS